MKRKSGPFVVELITGHKVTFFDPTEMRRAYAIANTPAEATQFPSKAHAEIRARLELPGGQFNVIDLHDPNAGRLKREVKVVPMTERRAERLKKRGLDPAAVAAKCKTKAAAARKAKR